MIFRIFNVYSIFTFNQSDFKNIVSNIKDSRGYLCYIDPITKQGKKNPRYLRYLQEKQASYTRLVPEHAKTKAPVSIFTTITDSSISYDKIEELGRIYGINDDFYYDYEIVSGDKDSSYIATHKVNLVEENCFDRATQTENIIQSVNDRYLNESFAWTKVRRFMLLPFLAKYNERYVEPVILATIYDVGIITLQVIISFEHEEMVSIESTTPNGFELKELQFYDVKSTYNTKDYWPKHEVKEAIITEVMKNYNIYLDAISGVKLSPIENLNQYAWVLSYLNYRQSEGHDKFIESNRKVILGYLQNSVQDRIKFVRDEEVNRYLDEATVDHSIVSRFFCSKQFAILSYGDKLFRDAITKKLDPIKDVLMENKLYEREFLLTGKQLIYNTMFEHLRFYELSFVKKFFATRLIKELATLSYSTLEDFNNVRKDMNFLLAKYDDTMIFQTEGSPKELYNKILEKTGTNTLVDKAQKLLNNLRDDIIQNRELVIKEKDMFTTILTSTIAVLFGFTGLKSFVDNGLIHLPWLGDFISKHPYRWTFGLWIGLFLGLGFLNWRKFLSYKR